MPDLFSPVQFGQLQCANRVVMAPLTRQRCPNRIPNDLTVKYYTQRASAGLIISEAASISKQGTGYADTPCIYTQEQVQGWKKVTQAVQQAGGRMVCQLWHVGRMSDPVFHDGEPNVAPSALRPEGYLRHRGKKKSFEVPRALKSSEISGIIDQYTNAAQLAMQAGFDGVEIHGANGYLLDQFLKDSTNLRTDMYGGSIENRCRLMIEVVHAVLAACPQGSVGLRLSPSGSHGDIHDSDPEALYAWLLSQLPARELAYIHFVDETAEDLKNEYKTLPSYFLRSEWKGKMILCGGMTRTKAIENIAHGLCDAVAFGKDYISNPDLVDRLKQNAPLNKWQVKTFYGGGEKGYTDYSLR